MHKTKNNKFFRLWRYKIKIQLYNVCILCNVWLKVANYILRSLNVQYPNWGASDVEYSTFDGRLFECRKSDIRRTADRMSKIRHPKKGASDVEYSTLDKRLFECRKSDIRRRALRMSNIRHSTMRPFESKKSDPTSKANRISDIRSDRMHTSHCTLYCIMIQSVSIQFIPIQDPFRLIRLKTCLGLIRIEVSEQITSITRFASNS